MKRGWDILPDPIKKHIIGFNPSLKKIHAETFSSTLTEIRRRKRDRQCTLCTRASIFGSPSRSSVPARPSTRMYVTLTCSTCSTTSSVRIRCMCKEHLMSEQGEAVVVVPRDVEYPSKKFVKFLKDTCEEEVSSILVYLGTADDLEFSTLFRVETCSSHEIFRDPCGKGSRYK